MKIKVNSPNKTWVSDTTYFKIKNRFYFICVIIGLYSRKVVAYKISNKKNILANQSPQLLESLMSIVLLKKN